MQKGRVVISRTYILFGKKLGKKHNKLRDSGAARNYPGKLKATPLKNL